MTDGAAEERSGYSERYFRNIQEGAAGSARAVVPLLFELARPGSVVDVGCGPGTWLAAFQEQGVEDFLGLDAHVDPKLLEIPLDRFVVMDLAYPFDLDRRFDLVVSLEVAEHLPPESAASFVHSLVKLGDVVVFSAAIPHQGGENHVNEQWPGYWAALFRRHGYVPVDCLRRRIWSNEEVAWWYAQNMFFYASLDHLDRYPALQREHELAGGSAPALVHPTKYLSLIEWVEEEFYGDS